MKSKILLFLSATICCLVLSVSVYAQERADIRDALVAIADDNPKKGFDIAYKLAEDGDMKAQGLLGEMYQRAIGTEQDQEKALFWLEKSSEQGNAKAMFIAAKLYAWEKHPQYDLKKAAYWYEKAAELGYKKAMTKIADIMINSDDPELRNFEKGVYWYKKAAEHKYIKAWVFLSSAYKNGKYGLPKDYAKHFEWAMKAARYRHVESQVDVGFAYYNGFGVEQDFEKSRKWFELAAKNGNSLAINFLEKMKNEGVI